MTDQTITIKRAALTDDASRTLIGELNAELSGMYPESGANHFRLDASEVSDGRGAFLIVQCDGTPVGCGAVRLLDRNDLGDHSAIDVQSAELKRMYISPAMRGKGLGRQLVAALEAEARALGVQQLLLETGTRQAAAIALYHATGFQQIPLYGEYCLSPETSVCFGKQLAD